MAKAIHYSGIRKDAHFVAINCAAIPETLLESEGCSAIRRVPSPTPGPIRRDSFLKRKIGSLFLDKEIYRNVPGPTGKTVESSRRKNIVRR